MESLPKPVQRTKSIDDLHAATLTRCDLQFAGHLQGFSARARRDLLRKTWVPTGRALQRLEDELGVVIRFIVGRS